MRRTREAFNQNPLDTRKEILDLVDWVSDDMLLIQGLQSIRGSLNLEGNEEINGLSVVDLFTKRPYVSVFARQVGYGFEHVIVVDKGYARLRQDLKFLANGAISRTILSDERFSAVHFVCSKSLESGLHRATSSFFQRILKPDQEFIEELKGIRDLHVPKRVDKNHYKQTGQNIGIFLTSFD